MPQARFPLKADAIRKAIKERGYTRKSFCQAVRRKQKSRAPSTKTLQLWISRTHNPTLSMVETMADVLRVRPEEIADLSANVADELTRSEVPRRLPEILGRHGILRSAVAIAGELESYFSLLSLNHHELNAENRSFENPGYSPPGFASIRIRSDRTSASWRFSHVLYGIRVTYGEITREGSDLFLDEYFQDREDDVELEDGEDPIIGTWFDRQPCKFVVHSSEPFEVEVLERGTPVHASFGVAVHHKRQHLEDGGEREDLSPARIRPR